MIELSTQLSPNFVLGELVPHGTTDVPTEVVTALEMLCLELLEPTREAMGGRPIHIHSGWRPEEYNAAAGGVPTSDHPHGRAADFHLSESPTQSWQDATLACFDWMRRNLTGRFGQLILEDRRKSSGDPGKLWIHVASPSEKHPGHNDYYAVLYSPAAQVYHPGGIEDMPDVPGLA